MPAVSSRNGLRNSAKQQPNVVGPRRPSGRRFFISNGEMILQIGGADALRASLSISLSILIFAVI